MFRTRLPPSITTKSAISAIAILGTGAYFTQSRFLTSAHAESNEAPKVFSGFGFTTLRLHSTKDVNHNTKRLVFEFADPSAQSGLSLTCKNCELPILKKMQMQERKKYITNIPSRSPHNHPPGRKMAPRTEAIHTNQRPE
jgi:hypothetical protein